MTMLGPVAQYDDTNDTSIVLRIDYGATSFLLTGDMEADAERDLVNSGANLKVDVLQVGHHGSSTSTSYVFLNAVLPEMGIISCGVNNKYGHPHEETLSIPGTPVWTSTAPTCWGRSPFPATARTTRWPPNISPPTLS
ncbi:MAG: ComEC/Rec2 family competence protein [Faecalibacterium prausnitzii]